MKALFVNDHKFKKDSNTGKVYSTGTLTSDIWNRYLSSFDSLTVAARDGGEILPNNQLTQSSAKNVSFYLFKDILTIKHEVLGSSSFNKQCKNLVKSHDAVIARLPSKLGLLFLKECKKQNKPYAIEVVGNAWDALWNYGNLKSKIYAPILELQTKRIVYSSPFTIYVTKNYLQKKYPCRKGITASCSNAEIDIVDPKVLSKRLKKIKKKSNKTVFGLIGHYSANYKGIDVAIKALANISPYIGNWELQVVGSGNPIKYIDLSKELGISDNIKFIGRLPSGKPIYNWIDNIDIYLQPSLVEGLPRALIEAMSRGCPAIGSDAGGISELLSCTQISKRGDYTQLSESILSTLMDDNFMIKLATENFEKASFYYKPILNQRRLDFWKDFSKYASLY